MRTSHKRPLRACESGAAAVEVALVLPLFLMLVLGILYCSLLAFSTASLHYAVQGAARCAALQSAPCLDAAATRSYAQRLYHGPSSPAPQFTASAAACGSRVSGSLTYVLDIAFARWSVPLTATACFP
jgi:Flp pilus assembly protein TadG